MAFEFRLPDIGEGLEDAEIVSWYVSPGDVVERDQALLEVLTDKASSELPSPVAGKVLKLSGQEGEKIKVGDVLIQIEEANSNSSQETSTEEVSKEIVEVEVDESVSSFEEKSNFVSVAPKVKASPATRKLARELEVDISLVSGTGASGRITNEDIQSAVKAANEATHNTASVASEPESLLSGCLLYTSPSPRDS